MQYNIHPLLIHFPIAFLLLYSILKILPLNIWLPSIAWKDIKRILLIFGVIGAFLASSTGEMAEHLAKPELRNLIEIHSSFAGISTLIFTVLLLGELLSIINPYLIKKYSSNDRFKKLIKISKFLEKIFTNKTLTFILAIIGIISITITGILGGAIVYGNTADPLAMPLLKIFGIQ